MGNDKNNVLNGMSGNDTLEGNGGNDKLNGGQGDDTYIFSTGDQKDIVSETSGNDTILFSDDVSKNKIAFYMDGSNLIIDYGNSDNQDQITVIKQAKTADRIENFQLNNGQYLSYNDINSIIADINSYAGTHTELTISSVTDVKSHNDLMATIANHWHS
jgi:Ca2+-binding RTX toxin-like protein